MATCQLISFKTCPWGQRAAIVLRDAFAKLERTLSAQPDGGPWFNAPRYSLVDAGYETVATAA
jgi:hypothetical protein